MAMVISNETTSFFFLSFRAHPLVRRPCGSLSYSIVYIGAKSPHFPYLLTAAINVRHAIRYIFTWFFFFKYLFSLRSVYVCVRVLN